MNPYTTFLKANARAKNCIALYELLCDQRRRSTRSDWDRKFKDLMHWPSTEPKLVRIDGKDDNSMLIIRSRTGITRKEFSHDYLDELLRAALVATTSALDRYMHDMVVANSWKLLKRAEADTPKKLKNFQIPILSAKRALERLRKDKRCRPGNDLKRTLQESLHKLTFLSSNELHAAACMAGAEDFWNEVSSNMSIPKQAVIDELDKLFRRRNQIVHEADMVLGTRATDIRIRSLTFSDTKDDVDWVERFVGAANGILGT